MDAAKPVKRTVVVLGMHRSGTSVVAGILHALGVNMGTAAGSETWVGKHWSNPTGHFENPEFVAIDTRLLGGDATGMHGPPHLADLAERLPGYAEEAHALVRRYEREMWGWKDPWTVLTLDLFLPYLRSPSFVFVNRPRDEVLASLRKRSTAQDGHIADLFDIYVERLAHWKGSLGAYPILEIDYPTLIAQPRPTVVRLIEFLGLRPTRDELDRALGMVLRGPELRRQSQRLAVRGFFGFPRWVGWLVIRDLRHNRRVVASDLLSSVPKEFYRMFRTLV